jgi:glycosyltransferase involved in cell wall biosynthesis
MLKRKIKIHQYHSGSAQGDAITNGMFYIQSILHQLGFESEIFCSYPAPQLSEKLHHIKKWRNDADLLFVHHSIGIDDEQWLTSQKCRKVLIYHNITPAEFFNNQTHLVKHIELGLLQVQRWRPMFEMAIADSEKNRQDLIAFGYSPDSIKTIPLLVDIDALSSIKPDNQILSDYEYYFNVVFVGRIVENKCQLDIVRAYARAQVRQSRPSRLVLVGGTTSESYLAKIKNEAEQLGVAQDLIITGKISDSQLVAIYRAAGVFVCLSKHEGFGVPLVEAMLFDIPVIALASSSVPWTLGRGGILFNELDLDEVAVAIDFIAQSPALRSKLIAVQRQELSRFKRYHLINELNEFLKNINIFSDFTIPTERIDTDRQWCIEGPLDSTYSLAILNRNLGRALVNQGVNITYRSSEGGGNFPANTEFLKVNPDIDERIIGKDTIRPNIVSRNLYPPRCTRMEGIINSFSLYGWEESIFPYEWVMNFNSNLNIITTMSYFVTKILIDSGVKIPIRTVGVGADHYIATPPKPIEKKLLNGFRFLHNSSCFPRKGVDTLLSAFGKYFSSRSDAVLIIKTFPNSHNKIIEQIIHFREQFPKAPEIQLIMEDLDDGQMAYLYANCNALVSPSRGEGFGLPMAEAMLQRIPVITTAYSGQTDFCNEDTAYLVDYKFSYSKSHFAEPGSIWVDPDVDSLGRAMLEVIDGNRVLREKRVQNARELIQEKFSWKAVAKRQIQAIEEISNMPWTGIQAIKVAWVSTWKTRCGIATYSESLVSTFNKERLWILANHQDEAPKNLPNVHRCWLQGSKEAGRNLLDAAMDLNVDTVVIQYNFGFFPLSALAELINGLIDHGKICVLTLHATKDVNKPDFKASFGEIKNTLARCSRILVHSVSDCNYLKQFDLIDNVTLFPHGAPPIVAEREPSQENIFTIGTFGYALPHKGLREVIEACALLRQHGFNIKLHMLNSRYPITQSDKEIVACKELIESQLDSQNAKFDDTYYTETEVAHFLAKCDLLVFAYQNTDESASGAVRAAMAACVPILCTPLPIFEDVSSVVDFSCGMSSHDLAASIERFIADAQLGHDQLERRRRWQQKVSWSLLSTRIHNMLEALVINQ